MYSQCNVHAYKHIHAAHIIIFAYSFLCAPIGSLNNKNIPYVVQMNVNTAVELS